jgi:hypothetical protein
VESDFSVISWEYDEFRGSLTESFLKGGLQCKQFERLQDMKYSTALRTQDILSCPVLVKLSEYVYSA